MNRTEDHRVVSDMQGDLIETIVSATKRSVEIRTKQRSRAEIERFAELMVPRGEEFRSAVSNASKLNVIAECKRRSPLKGVLCLEYDPVRLATDYEGAGASAISVLTERAFFDGSLDHLRTVRSTVELPLLCKDFIVCEYQLLEARASGADAVLLIVSALDQEMLKRLVSTAAEFDLSSLVEVHDEIEQARALDAGATIIGVNNRNLRTLEVDLDVAHSLISNIPHGVISVAESGLRSAEDLTRLRKIGYDAFLIGEFLMTSGNPGQTLRALLSQGSTVVG